MPWLEENLAMLTLTAYLTTGGFADFDAFFMRIASLAAGLGMIWYLLALKGRGRISPVSRVIAGFLIFLSALWWFLPGPASAVLPGYSASLLYLGFVGMAVLPQLMGRPYFCEYFAEKQTPRKHRDNDIYRAIVRNMAWIWAGLFLVCLALSFIPRLLGIPQPWLLLLTFGGPMLVLFLVGFPLNKKYPAYYQKKLGIEPVNAQSGPPDPEPGSQKTGPGKQGVNKMETKYTVCAVSASPHVVVGNSDMMIQMLVDRLEPKGVGVEVIHLDELNIGYCKGCAHCLQKGRCWQADDHNRVTKKILQADGLILASPVYFHQVTAQMKTFLDRSLWLGHKPRGTAKPGIAISVSAGMGEMQTASYLEQMLRVYGAFSLGSLTAISVGPGEFLGKESVEAKADDLARVMVDSIKGKRRYPVSEYDLRFWLFMGYLVKSSRDFMIDDYEYWQEKGMFESFEDFVGQARSRSPQDLSVREAWIADLISEQRRARKQTGSQEPEPVEPQPEKTEEAMEFSSCRELIDLMPKGFNSEKAGDLAAVVQFDITGDEEFTAHLDIKDGACRTIDGPAESPDLTIKAPADVWLAISSGKMNGQMAFMSGKFKAKGDFGLLMKFGKLFTSS